MEDEMSMAGRTRMSDAMMRTPMQSQSQMEKHLGPMQLGDRLEGALSKKYNFKNPESHD
jgi:hypothetical protein